MSSPNSFMDPLHAQQERLRLIQEGKRCPDFDQFKRERIRSLADHIDLMNEKTSLKDIFRAYNRWRVAENKPKKTIEQIKLLCDYVFQPLDLSSVDNYKVEYIHLRVFLDEEDVELFDQQHPPEPEQEPEPEPTVQELRRNIRQEKKNQKIHQAIQHQELVLERIKSKQEANHVDKQRIHQTFEAKIEALQKEMEILKRRQTHAITKNEIELSILIQKQKYVEDSLQKTKAKLNQ